MIINIDPGFVAREVCDWPHHAYRRIVEMAQQATEPAGWHHRVVIQKHKPISGAARNPLIVGTGKAAVLCVQNDLNVRMLRGHAAQILRGLIPRVIVDHNHFIVRIVSVSYNTLKTQTR